ncbi:hydrolase 2, exosortase A system-associated [Roseateles oligotrophus]|uniref:hydrolase 2, exosortase A system-associated n=1 Tax=Roseateles oligotrophus TaxID=1769250 RepID=UPI0021E4FB87|nr:hydrolase 2, exosortase A system-associated [Roseateles oligotrophus]
MPAAPPSTGQRFCIFHASQGGTVLGRVVYVHPFAEEMNKSRRMAAIQSRALAAAGFSVLQIDLHGCGDSSGDFGDASWDGWVNDVVKAVDWLTERDEAHANAPLWLWGLRAGCLVAVDAAAKLNEPSHFCFWQPAISGKLILQQFLRIKLAADMLSGNSKGLMDEMKLALAQGQSLEIAGYALSAALARGLEQAALLPPSTRAADSIDSFRLAWFELSSREDAEPTPANQQHLKKWAAADFAGQIQLIQGPSFWQTQEIEDAPALVTATCAAFLTESEISEKNRATRI